MSNKEPPLVEWKKAIGLAKTLPREAVISLKRDVVLSVDSIYVRLMTEEAQRPAKAQEKKKTIKLACRLLQTSIDAFVLANEEPSSGKVEDPDVLKIIKEHEVAIAGLKALLD